MEGLGKNRELRDVSSLRYSFKIWLPNNLVVLFAISIFDYVDAAEVLRQNRRLFEQNVQRTMRGGYIGSTYFERCLVR